MFCIVTRPTILIIDFKKEKISPLYIEHGHFQKTQTFIKKRNFYQKTRLLSKVQTSQKNLDFYQKPRLLSKNATFIKSPDFSKKPRLFTKVQTFSKVRTF